MHDLSKALTFKQGKRLELDDYSIGVPDGFEVEQNANGLNFRIWMPLPEDSASTDDELSPLFLEEDGAADEAPNEAIQTLLFKEAYPYCFASMALRSGYGERAPIVLKTRNIPAFYFTSPVVGNYKVVLVFSNRKKTLHFRLEQGIWLLGSDETAQLESILATWVDTVELKEPYPIRKPLDDPEFFKDGVTEQSITAWGNYAAQWIHHATYLRDNAVQYEVYRYNFVHQAWSFSSCKPKLLPHLERNVEYYNQMLAEILSCVEKLHGSCSDVEFSRLCQVALQLSGIDTSSEELGDDVLELKTDAPKFRKEIEKYC